MTIHVGPDGPLDAQLILVGEKYGREEAARGLPFVGSTGEAVTKHLSRVGLRREEVYLTNVIHDGTNFDNPTDAEIKAALPRLYRELVGLRDPRCIIALGDVALQALSNFHLQGISKWRGSIIETAIKPLKMVPTFHPSFYFRGEWRFKPIVDHDFLRAKLELGNPGIDRRARTFWIRPTFAEALYWLDEIKGARWVSFDIETFKPAFIGCIAFSTHPDNAYCIPIMHNDRKPYWRPSEEVRIWRAIQGVLADERSTFVTQNGMFDCYHLWRHGVSTPHMARGFDTMYAHRNIAADLPHDLGFLVSLYTNPVEAFYKDESGSWAKDVRVPERQFWVYNCKDAATTLEIAWAMMEDMKEVA